MSWLDKNIVLCLNANWQPISTVTPQDAFVAMSREKRRHYSKNGKRPYCALHIEYPLLPDGVIDSTSPVTFIPTEWKDWIRLPVRSIDKYINTASSQIRIPTVIIANNYYQIPTKKAIKFSKQAVRLRDNDICQISGELLSRSDGSIDHYIPRSLGGPTSFENCILVKREINSKRGNLPMEEFCKRNGFKVPPKPKAPNLSIKIINKYNIPDWNLFL